MFVYWLHDSLLEALALPCAFMERRGQWYRGPGLAYVAEMARFIKSCSEKRSEDGGGWGTLRGESRRRSRVKAASMAHPLPDCH